jgi:hypothetical protein
MDNVNTQEVIFRTFNLKQHGNQPWDFSFYIENATKFNVRSNKALLIISRSNKTNH